MKRTWVRIAAVVLSSALIDVGVARAWPLPPPPAAQAQPRTDASPAPVEAPSAAPLPPPPGFSPSPPMLLQPGPPPGPVVYLRSDRAPSVLQVQTGLHLWLDVCREPCGVVVDPSRRYRVAAHHFIPTEPVTLPRDQNQVMMNAHLARQARRTVGYALTPLGAGVALTGAFLFSTDHASGESFDSVWRFYGAVAMVAGVGMLLAGLISLSDTTSDVTM